MKYLQGRFHPHHPGKYRGDLEAIIFRSSWERTIMLWLDGNPSVLWWGSEPFAITYLNPVDQKVHRYFPDFTAHIRQKTQREQTFLIEVKPQKETVLRPAPGRPSKVFLREAMTYSINRAKWDAAEIFCAAHAWKFLIITEEHLPGMTSRCPRS